MAQSISLITPIIWSTKYNGFHSFFVDFAFEFSVIYTWSYSKSREHNTILCFLAYFMTFTNRINNCYIAYPAVFINISNKDGRSVLFKDYGITEFFYFAKLSPRYMILILPTTWFWLSPWKQWKGTFYTNFTVRIPQEVSVHNIDRTCR